MVVYRASRRPHTAFDPLDSSASVARDGWRFNDKRSEILYAAEVQALAILEVAARPGWDTVAEMTIAAIEVPDGSVLDLSDLGIVLPSNWNIRPAAPNAQGIGAEFLAAVDRFDHAFTCLWVAQGGQTINDCRAHSFIVATPLDTTLRFAPCHIQVNLSNVAQGIGACT